MTAILSSTIEKPAHTDDAIPEAFAELTAAVHAALETYSNVHRGSGLNSIVSTRLYEHARDIVLEYLGLSKTKYVVIFCTPRRAEALKACIKPEGYKSVSSQDIGLPLGVRALAVNRAALPNDVPFLTGGGTARLVSIDRITWAQAPDRFEAGTPAIVNIIAFAKALQLIRRFGDNVFLDGAKENLGVAAILYGDELEGSGYKLLDAFKQTLIGQSVRVPTAEGIKPYVNLDNAASTPTFAPIWNAAWRTWRQPRHVQQEIIDEVKSICARALSAPLTAYDVIFTSNTTEAINLTAESLSKETEQGIEPVVVNTLLEHNSNELPWRMLPAFSIIRLPVDAEGFMDLIELDAILSAYNQKAQHGRKRIALVAVSGASNVLGTCNDLAEIGRIAHRYGARLLVDAAQLVAHRRVEMEKCGIDYLAFSAHKVYAPFGCGVLVAKKGLLNFSPSERERIQSSSEENAGGIAALGKALVLLQRIGLDIIQAEEQTLTKRTLRGLAQIPGLRIYGIQDEHSPRFSQKGGVILFGLKAMMAHRVAKELAIQGIGVRSGCHCAHMLIKHLLNIPPLLKQFQHVLLFFFPRLSLPGLARVSLGIENSETDVDTLIQALGTIARQRQTGRNQQSVGAPNEPPIVIQPDVQQRMDNFARAAVQRVYAEG
jgi:selenocysteine lyase/cysteine desulfurase